MAQTGALIHLAKQAGGASLAGPDSPLLLVRYQTLVESDFQAWQKEYILPGAGGGNEFGKPSGFMTGADGQPIQKVLAPPTLRAAWTDHTAATLLLALDFSASLHLAFGASSSPSAAVRAVRAVRGGEGRAGALWAPTGNLS